MTYYGIIGSGHLGRSLTDTLTERGHRVTSVDQSANPPRDVEAVDVVIEAVSEDFALKTEVLGRLQGVAAPVLTTTSSFTVHELAAASGLGGRLAGFHHLASYGGQLAELVTVASDPAAATAARQLAEDLGVEQIEAQDVPGRISRRLLAPFIENALRAVELEIADPDDIDQIICLGLGHKVGPLRRVREAGLDEHRAVVAALGATAPSSRQGAVS